MKQRGRARSLASHVYAEVLERARRGRRTLTYRPVFGDAALRHREALTERRIALRQWVRLLGRSYQLITPASNRHPLPRRLAAFAAATALDHRFAVRQRANPDWDGLTKRFASAAAEEMCLSAWGPGERYSAGVSLMLFPDEFEATVLRGPATALAGSAATSALLFADHRRRRRSLRAWSWRYSAAGYVAACAYRYRLYEGLQHRDNVTRTRLENRRELTTVVVTHTLSQAAPTTTAFPDLLKEQPRDPEWPEGAESLVHLVAPYQHLRAAYYRHIEQPDRQPSTLHGLINDAANILHGRPGEPSNLSIKVGQVFYTPSTVVDLHPQQIRPTAAWLGEMLKPEILSYLDGELVLEVTVPTSPAYLGDEIVVTIGPVGGSESFTIDRVVDRTTSSAFDPLFAAYVMGMVWGLLEVRDEPMGASTLIAASGLGALLARKRALDHRLHAGLTVGVQIAATAAWRMQGRTPHRQTDGLDSSFPVVAAYLPSLVLSSLRTRAAGGGSAGAELQRISDIGAAVSVLTAVGGMWSSRHRHGTSRRSLGAALLHTGQLVLPAWKLYEPLGQANQSDAAASERRLEAVAAVRAHHTYMTVLGPALDWVDRMSQLIDQSPDPTVYANVRNRLTSADSHKTDLLQRAADTEALLVR